MRCVYSEDWIWNDEMMQNGEMCLCLNFRCIPSEVSRGGIQWRTVLVRTCVSSSCCRRWLLAHRQQVCVSERQSPLCSAMQRLGIGWWRAKSRTTPLSPLLLLVFPSSHSSNPPYLTSPLFISSHLSTVLSPTTEQYLKNRIDSWYTLMYCYLSIDLSLCVMVVQPSQFQNPYIIFYMLTKQWLIMSSFKGACARLRWRQGGWLSLLSVNQVVF